jgi:hypothetical protein
MLQLCSETHVGLINIDRYFCSALTKNGMYRQILLIFSNVNLLENQFSYFQVVSYV